MEVTFMQVIHIEEGARINFLVVIYDMKKKNYELYRELPNENVRQLVKLYPECLFESWRADLV